LSKNALLFAGGVVLLGLAVLLIWRFGLKRTMPDPVPADVAASRPGWEIRYNATIALARRGSDKAADRLDVLEEMLDEQKQRANFAKREGDRQVVDEAGANATVLNALKAIVQLHDKNPALDLSPLNAAIQKLTQSSNAALRTEAEQTRIKLTQPK
jgi:hypothetical protein